MDFLEFGNLKPGKPSLDFNRLRSFAKMLRTAAEVCVALALLSWAFDRLPFAVRISGEFLRRLAAVVSSPLFVFLLSNAIVASLIAKSRGGDNAGEDVNEDLVKSSRDNDRFAVPNSSSEDPNPNNNIPPCHVAQEEVVYQDKEIILSQVTRDNTHNNDETLSCYVSDSESDPDSDAGNPKAYRMLKSEKRLQERKREYNKVISMWDTEKRSSEGDPCPEDELSDEEFQRTVDDFIAKHLKFRRAESLAIVVQSHNNRDPYPSPSLVESARS